MVGQCTATNKDGRPCSARGWKDGLCRWHHPDMRQRIDDGRRLGGKGKSSEARARKRLAGHPRDLAGVKAMLLEGMEKTVGGEMEPGVLTALSTAARAVIAISGVVEFEEQLADLRRQIADLHDQRGA